ncbi:uncharacterized protein LOC123534983 isoform X2 [Mercenaria mercenaria]|uniref:uncharacterized protein LOC123534983 isoform X2 n=2 Tax=Mercenaria mercenaria TaxID=6596 RepID=UPI00234FA23E|nr:uncharacterized protein LOC123534983 isoform X2 [Mercenaria mercenaria]
MDADDSRNCLTNRVTSETYIHLPAREATVLPRRTETIRTALNKVKTKLSLTDEGATPVNWKCMFLVFIPLFSSSLNIAFISSFLPEMILTFGYKETDKGYYAGLIASAMFVGRVFGSYFWGWMGDRIGRRPILLVTVSLVGLCSLMFGFTTNIYFAITVRFLSGLVNGVAGLAKTMLYELTDNTNQAVGVSVAGIGWGTGIIVGPAVGGFLADPSKRFPGSFTNIGLFERFPYILPSFFAFITCLITVIVDFIWLPETLSMRKTEEVIVEDNGSADIDTKRIEPCQLNHTINSTGSRETLARRAVSLEHLNFISEYSFLINESDLFHRKGKSLTDLRDRSGRFKQKYGYKECSDSEKRNIFHTSLFDGVPDKTEAEDSNRQDIDDCLKEKLLSTQVNSEMERVAISNDSNTEDNMTTKCFACFSVLRNWSVIRLMSQFDIFLAITLYSVFSFGIIGVEEIFTVWTSTDIMLDGLGFAPNEIGIVLAATAFPLLFIQLFLFPNLVRRFGIKKTMLICTILMMVFTECMPCLHLLINQPVTLWVLLMTNNILMTLMMYCVFSCTYLLVNNSVKPELAGQVNGLAMTLVAITRSISPIVGGTIYSWNVGYTSDAIGPPLDVSFVFFAFGLVFWLVAAVCVTIPESLNNQKK